MLDTGKYYYPNRQVDKLEVVESTWSTMMSRCFQLVSLTIGILAFGCGDSANETSPTINWNIPTTTEDQLLTSLTPFLEADPVDTPSIENNFLINWVIDHRLDLQRTKSGIFYHILKQGAAPGPVWGDKVLVDYEGYLLDGTLFDSSYEKNQSFSFYIGNVIPGWNEALPMLGEDGRGIFIIPSHLAYGHEGFGNKVPPDKHLRFNIHLKSILDTE